MAIFNPTGTQNLSPSLVPSIKSSRPNDKVALNLGGDTIDHHKVFFKHASVDSWLQNVTHLVQSSHLDGIDIDQKHFGADLNSLAECVSGS